MVQPIGETTTPRQHERRNDETTKQRSDERGNDKTTPPFGKSFLRPGGMRASAFRRPLVGRSVPDTFSDSCSSDPKSAKSGEVWTSPYLSGGTPPSAGPTQNPGNLVFWTNISDFSGFLADLLPDQKNTKNQAPPKTSQNHKKPALGRQKLRFSSIFGDILASIFHEISESPKSWFFTRVPSKNKIFASQSLPFWHQKSFQISCFSGTAPGPPFSRFFPT